MLKLWTHLIVMVVVTPFCLAQSSSIPAPEAQVTFYSTGTTWKTFGYGYKHGVFAGLVFDDEQLLLHMKGDRFVTFTLHPGEHMFSATYWFDKKQKHGAHLKLDLAPGRHYYVATYFNARPLIGPVPLMEQSTCEDAQKDAATAKPLPESDLEKEAVPYLVAESHFPQCS